MRPAKRSEVIASVAKTRIDARSCLTALVAAAALAGSASAAPASRFLVTVVPAGQSRLSSRPIVEIVSRNGTLERVVAPAGSSYPYQAAFSPDGLQLAWAARDGVLTSRTRTEPASGSSFRRRRRARIAAPSSFAGAPDSRALAVGGAGGRTNELLLVPLDGSASTPLAPAAPTAFFTAKFWTAGGSLVYSSTIASRDPTNPGCCHAEIVVTTPATGETRTLFTTRDVTDPSALPLVSPDLRYQATVRETREQSRHELRLLDTTTGRTRVLKGVNPADASSVVWSPDARTLAVVEQEENRHVVTVDVASGEGATGRPRPERLVQPRGQGCSSCAAGASTSSGRQRTEEPQHRLFRMPRPAAPAHRRRRLTPSARHRAALPACLNRG